MKTDKEKHKIFVDPRNEAHALDLPFWRNNELLHALDIPTEDMKTEELIWMMDIPFWEDNEGNIVLTPNEVLANLDKWPDHRDRINNSDTSFALHIMQNEKKEWVMLDGLHRFVKLIMEGVETVKVKKVSLEQVMLTKQD